MTCINGFKMVFINMPIRENASPNTPPLGLALLAARLREFGADVSIIDLNAYRIKDDLAKEKKLTNGRHLTLNETEKLICKHLNKYGNQDCVAISGIITTLRWQTTIAKIVKKLQPNAILVSGGGLATEIRETLFKWIPELDSIAIGEGDEIVTQIAQDIKIIKKKGWFNALNSGLSKNSKVIDVNSKTKLVYVGQPVIDLNALSLPAWDLLAEDVNGFRIFDFYLSNPVWGGSAQNSSAAPFTMEKSITTVSSRGCPFCCKFCYRGTQGQRRYRTRSAECLIKEITWLIDNYQVDFIGFNDDNFMIDQKRVESLINRLSQTKIRWGTHGRLDTAANLKNVENMVKAGCVYIGFGAESAHPEVLKNMGKGGEILSNGTIAINGYKFPKTMIDGIKNTIKMGIHGNCTWIMGYPGETLEQLKTSVAFIKWQEEFYAWRVKPKSKGYEVAKNSVNKNMFVATAYPGTEMTRHPIVRKKLSENFGINFDPITLEPICDENLRLYVLELEDATKLLVGPSGKPINFSNMPDDIFLQAKNYVETGQIFKILEM